MYSYFMICRGTFIRLFEHSWSAPTVQLSTTSSVCLMEISAILLILAFPVSASQSAGSHCFWRALMLSVNSSACLPLPKDFRTWCTQIFNLSSSTVLHSLSLKTLHFFTRIKLSIARLNKFPIIYMALYFSSIVLLRLTPTLPRLLV